MMKPKELYDTSPYRGKFRIALVACFPLGGLLLGWAVLFAYKPLAGIGLILIIFFCIFAFSHPFWTVLAFIFTLPFCDLLNLPVTADGFKLSTGILLAAFSIWIVKALLTKDQNLFITPLSNLTHVLILSLFIFSFISIINSRNPRFSLVEIQEFTYCVIIYFFLVSNVKEIKQLDKVIFAFVSASFLVSLFGIAEGVGWNVYSRLSNNSLFGSSLPSAILESPPNRINGLIGDADFHGIYMGVVFLFSLYLFFTNRSRVLRLFFTGVMSLSVINIVGAASRGAALGFLCSLLIFWAFIELARKWLISVLMLGTILLLGFLMLTFIPDLEIERFYRPKGIAKSTLELRWTNVVIGLAMTRDHPFIGYGPDGFVANYHRFAAQSAPSAQKRRTKPLNVYIQVLVEYGIVGLTIFVSILCLALRSLFLVVKGSTGNDRYLPAVLLSSLCGYSVFMAFTGSFTNQNYWTLIALSIVMISMSPSKFPNKDRSIGSREGIGGSSPFSLQGEEI